MKKLVALLVLVVAALALVACGSSSGGSNTAETSQEGAAKGGGASEASGGSKEEGGGGSTVKFEADPSGNLAYTTTEATAKAGKVTIDFNNPQGLDHDVAIENSKGEEVGATEIVAEGEASTSVNLEPGTYHYFCTIPGHREAGMEGTLVVE